jgi:carboxypeptidase family protein
MNTNCRLLLIGALLAQVVRAEGMILEVDKGSVRGRVIDAKTEQGIPGLIIKLTPPKATKQPQKVTSTDPQGEFRFEKVVDGRYLLEVYQGLSLLYRDVVDTTKPSKKAISLKRKGSP